MSKKLPDFLNHKEVHAMVYNKRGNQAFIDRTLAKVAGFIQKGHIQYDISSRKGLLQGIESRMKIIFLFFFIICINFESHFFAQVGYFILWLILYATSRLKGTFFLKTVLISGVFFGIIIVLPASLNIFAPGNIILPLLKTETPFHYWIFHLPTTVGFTREGCFLVCRLYLKITNALALTLLVFYTTSFGEMISSLAVLRVPGLLLMILALAYRFMFILSLTIENTYMALKSRCWRSLNMKETDLMVGGRIAHVLKQSFFRYEETYKAMVSRGYTGVSYSSVNKSITWKDGLFLLLTFGWGFICLFFNK